jgi:hypothetical protein
MTIRERSIFFDVEAFRHESGRHLWCVGFRWTTDGKQHVEVVNSENPNAIERLRYLIETAIERGRLLVGFNVKHYDLPFIVALMNTPDIDAKNLSDELVRNMERPDWMDDDTFRDVKRKAVRDRSEFWQGVIPNDHVLDLASRYRESENEALRKGLKTVAALLGFNDIQEMPYHHDTHLNDGQWLEVIEYNLHDLKTTEYVFDHHESTFEALVVLSESCGKNLVGLSDSDAAESYFNQMFRIKTGTQAGYIQNQPESVRLVVSNRFPDLKTPDALDWQRFVSSTDYPYSSELKSLDTLSDVYKKSSRKFIVGDLELSVGFGGIHSVHTKDVSEFYRSDDEFEVVNCDVASYYPNLILKNQIPIGTTGSIGLEIYQHALEQRLELKRQSKDKSLPLPVRQRAKIADTAFKVVANSLFGKMGYRWSRLNTPGSLPTVTVVGQIGLIHLIEELQGVGCRVVQANTDGVVFVARREDQRWKAVCDDWQHRLELVLEFESYKALALSDSNNWLAMRSDGSLYGKGLLRVTSGGQHQQHTPSIIKIAMMEALVNRTPPETTINLCDDINQFLFIEPTRGRFSLVVGSDSKPLGKCLRGYASYKWNNQRLESTGERPAKLPEFIGLGLKIPDRVPSDLNREWYVGHSRRLLESFQIPFRPEELSGDALKLWNLGLVPQPAFGKISGSGTGPKINAVSCVNWNHYPTLKIHTGVQPGQVAGVSGIVVFDIDHAEKWQAVFGVDLNAIVELEPLTVHKTPTPEPVWNGSARGKLVFRLTDMNHRFGDAVRDTTRHKWLEQYGFEIFYGRGTASCLGDAGNGERYRLSGRLCDLPKWFESKIISVIGRGSRTRRQALNGLGIKNDNVILEQPEPVWSDVIEYLVNNFDRRFDGISYVSEQRGIKLQNGGRDERYALRLRCPGGRESHESGKSNQREAELFLDSLSGLPVFKCKHQSCQFQVEFDAWVHGRPPMVGSTQSTPNTPDVKTTPISDIITNTRGITLVEATTGSGKTHGACVAAGIAARSGRHVFYATTSINLVRQFRDKFVELNPDLVDRIAMKRDEMNSKLRSEVEDVAELNEELEQRQTPELEDKILVRVICHESLCRRDFSRFARHMWTVLREHPDALLIVDEFDAFVSPGLELKYPFGVRAVTIGSDKHKSWSLQVLNNCPSSLAETSKGFRSCEDCQSRLTTGRFMRSEFGTPTLERPAFAWRKSLNEPVTLHSGHEVVLNLDDFQRLEPQRVHSNAEVQPVVAYRGTVINRVNRRGLVRNSYTGDFDESTAETPETVGLVWEHIIGHMLFPAIKTHFPTSLDDSKMTPDEVSKIPARGRNNLVNFPVRTCHSPYLVGVDSMPLEMLREFATTGGVVLMTATLSELTESVISECFGDIKRHKVESSNVKIEAVSVVTISNDSEPVRLSQIEPASMMRLQSNDWHDELGKWLILTPSIRSVSLVSKQFESSPLNYAVAVGSGQSFGERRMTTSHQPIAGTLASVRQPVARGYDGIELGMVVLDVRSTRLAVDMMVRHARPDEDIEKVYEHFTNEELVTTIGQACGRGLRGDEVKRFVLVLLNCSPHEAKYIIDRFGMNQRTNTVGYIHYPVVSDGVFRDAERWLAKTDDQWVSSTTIAEQSASKHEHRILERTASRLSEANTRRSDLLNLARDAFNDGVQFREFVQNNNVARKSKSTIPGVLDEVRKIFNVTT